MEEQKRDKEIHFGFGTSLFILLIIAVGVTVYFGIRSSKYDSTGPKPTPTIVGEISFGSTNSGSKTNGEGVAPIVDEATELKIEDYVVGSGDEAVSGKQVTVNYLGTLSSGQKFDSSYDRNQPFTFNLGAGEVIPGWDQGVVGMKVGGKRKLTIPSSLAYGDSGVSGAIPPKATLVFEIELLKVE